MRKETIIYLKKVDPKNPHTQQAIYIHDETVAASLIGDRKSPKVSDIRFDEGAQEWVAVLRDGKELCRDKNRNVVVQKEATMISDMFARREYIPGGYNGEPTIVQSLNLSSELIGCKYLGLHGGVELFANGPAQRIKCVVVWGAGEFAVFEATGDFDVLGSIQESDLERAGVECIRRYRIELQIEEEEKIKTPHHA